MKIDQLSLIIVIEIPFNTFDNSFTLENMVFERVFSTLSSRLVALL